MVTARIYFLGTGAAMPIDRMPSCIALKVDSNIYLIDPGEGCQARMFMKGLSPVKVKTVIITHGHGDHYLGLFGLLMSMTLSNRETPLTIIAPRKLREILEHVLKSGLINIGFKIEFLDAGKDFTYSDSKITVKSFPVNHSTEAYGYRFTVNKKSICYTGDTAPSESIVENCRDVDILIHEATFTSIYEEEAHAQGHSTALDAARTALKTNTKLLVLYHISARHDDNEVFYDAYRLFQNIVVAFDGMVILL